MTGTYYTSITNFMQGYIDNEINLNEQHTCDGSCSVFKSTRNTGCQSDTMCAQSHFARTRCRGNIFDCSVIESDGVACRVVCLNKFNFQTLSSATTHFLSVSYVLCSISFFYIFFFVFFAVLFWNVNALSLSHQRRKMNGRNGATIM